MDYTERKKLKVAMLGHKRIPSREGGVEVVVEELATRMVERGCEVTCYNRAGHHISGEKYDSKHENEYKGVHLRTVWTIDKKGIAAMTSSLSSSLLAAGGKYDIVHVHAEGPAAVCWIPKLFGKKIIVTIHGLDWKRDKWKGVASKYIYQGEKAAVRFADEIIVLSAAHQKYFREKYGRETVLIPNGISKSKSYPASKIKELWNLEKNSYVLFLGRLVPEKGIKYLLEAWNSIKTNKKLVIAGGSSDTNDFVEELKEMGGDNVLFTGFVQDEILHELYSNAYLYCLPSDLEGMSIGLLEAMSYGSCCLLSDIQECKEVAGDYAVYFKKSSVEDLKSKLEMLLSDPSAVDFYRKRSSDYICNKYNWEEVVEKTVDVYTKTFHDKID